MVKRMLSKFVVVVLSVSILSGCGFTKGFKDGVSSGMSSETKVEKSYDSEAVSDYIKYLQNSVKEAVVGVDYGIEAITFKPDGNSIDALMLGYVDNGVKVSFEESIMAMSIEVDEKLPGFSFAVLDSKGERAYIAYQGIILFDKSKGGFISDWK